MAAQDSTFLFNVTDHSKRCVASIAEGNKIDYCPVRVRICPYWTVRKWIFLAKKCRKVCGRLDNKLFEEETLGTLLHSEDARIRKAATEFMRLTGVTDPSFWKKKAIKAFFEGRFFPVLE